MTRATTTHTKTPRRAHPAVLRAALRTHNRNDTESGRVAAQQRGTHRPTPCGYNRVIEVHDAANAIIATYRYDPFGRRLSKTANNQSTYYFYSAEGLIAEADANGQIIQSYGYAPGSTFTTNPLWTKLTTAGTATYYTYQNDHLGTPQKLLNQRGLTVWSATYDAFGKATVDPASTITNNLRFPGQYADQETGLHYNWNRYYDTATGRYVTWDPIGLRGGINEYAYVGGNPMMFIDSYGLCIALTNNQIEIVGGVVGGAAAGFTTSGFAGGVLGGALGGISTYATQQFDKSNVGGQMTVGALAGAAGGGNRIAGVLVGATTAGIMGSGNQDGNWGNTAAGLAGGVFGGAVSGVVTKGAQYRVITYAGSASWAGLVGGFFQDFTLALLKQYQCKRGDNCGQ